MRAPGKAASSGLHQREDLRRGAPAGLGGAALLGQGRLALGIAERDGPARAGGAPPAARPSAPARSRGAPGWTRSSIRPGAKRTGWTRGPDARAASASGRRPAPPPRATRGRRRPGRRPHRPAGTAARGPLAPIARSRRRRFGAGPGRAPAGGAPPSGSRFTRSPGVGNSATWARRISTISAAARRSGASFTSPGPSAASARRGRAPAPRAAPPAPRRALRSPSVSDGSSFSAGTLRSRVSVWVSSSRSCSTTAGSAPRSWRAVEEGQRRGGIARHQPLPSGPAPWRGRPDPACRAPHPW